MVASGEFAGDREVEEPYAEACDQDEATSSMVAYLGHSQWGNNNPTFAEPYEEAFDPERGLVQSCVVGDLRALQERSSCLEAFLVKAVGKEWKELDRA